MSYIQPNTELILYENVPLTMDYQNVLWLQSETGKTAQDAILSELEAYKKYDQTKLSYQRAYSASLKIGLPYEQVYRCNYMAFKNNAYENHWFFAFICGWQYVNNNTTLITYKLDFINTWRSYFYFTNCYITRQHSATDNLYENTRPEGLEIGALYDETLLASNNIEVSGVSIQAGEDPNGDQKAYGNFDGDILIGYYEHFDTKAAGLEKLKEFVSAGKVESIATAYMTCKAYGATLTGFASDRLYKLKNYTPRNKKLLCYPFRYLQVSNRQGGVGEYRFEYFDSVTPSFESMVSYYPSFEGVLYPTNYNGGVSPTNYGVTYPSLPTCGYAGDAYISWWAQNANSYAVSMLTYQRNYDTSVNLSGINQQIAANSACNAYLTAGYATEQSNAAKQLDYDYSIAGVADSIAQSLLHNNVSDTISQAVKTGAQAWNGTTQAEKGMKTGGTGWEWLQSKLSGNSDSWDASQSQTINVSDSEASSAANLFSSAYDLASGKSKMQAYQQLNTRYSNMTRQANYNTSMANAALTQQASQLSALNTYQNAVDALNAKVQDIEHTPNQLQGNAYCSGLYAINDKYGFDYIMKSVKNEYAKKVDAYFDVYGYAQNSFEVPKVMNRRHWSYIQTAMCNIKGNIPADDANAIKAIFQNGTTAWRHLSEIGDYTLDNSIGSDYVIY